MDPFLTSIIAICVCSILAGFIIGIMFSRMRQASSIEKAKETVRNEFKREKEDLARDLGGQMKKLRDSISLSIGAYESTLETIEAKLNIKEEEQIMLQLDSPKPAKTIASPVSELATEQPVADDSEQELEAGASTVEKSENETSESIDVSKQDLDLLNDAAKQKKEPLIH